MFNGWILRIIHEELVKKVRRWCSNPSDIMDTKEHSAVKISIMKSPHTRSPPKHNICASTFLFIYSKTLILGHTPILKVMGTMMYYEI